MGIYGNYFDLERLNMLVNKIMQVLSNLFGLNKKINANDIAVKDNNNNARTLDKSVIIDSGSNENGSWVKWADGTMICTKRVSFVSKFNMAWGAFYETPTLIPIGSFAKTFIDVPIISITSSIGSTVIPETPYDFGKDGIIGITLARPVKSDSEIGGEFDITAIGKWK